MKSIHKLLIANRGEPVIRALRTLRRLGIQTGVVFAPEDAARDWIGEVDFALPLYRSPALSTPYLDGAQIIACALQHDCDAIWPAWGFLAENADFAQAVIDAGLVWVGPPVAAMRALGSKTDSSALAIRAGVPTIPEVILTESPVASRRSPVTAVSSLGFAVTGDRRPATGPVLGAVGFPILLKPALGGGGQGQVIVQRAEDFDEALAQVVRINAAQFQNGPILVQRFIANARHIEAQVLADAHGNIVVFHERDCSIQRRNQKVVEESPSPAMTGALRDQLQTAARNLAQAAGYQSAGTLEFLLADGELFFLEMNTRLQVEHPITEETTRWIAPDGRWRRLDLIEEMIRVARGEPLRFTQAQVRMVGHSIEVRVYAEDPARDFQPSPGWITALRLPYGEGIRVDTGVRGPTAYVDPQYDPMIGKLISTDDTRAGAIAGLRRALEVTGVTGIATNIAFAHALLGSADFSAGDYTTRFIAQHPELLRGASLGRGVAVIAAVIEIYEQDRRRAMDAMMSGEVTSVAAVIAAVPPNGRACSLVHEGRTIQCRVGEWGPEQYAVECDGVLVTCRVPRNGNRTMLLIFSDGAVVTANCSWSADTLHVACGGEMYTFVVTASGQVALADPHAASGGGRLVRVAVAAGDTVVAGDLLYTMEAMKMESRVLAAFDGTIHAVNAHAGDAIEAGHIVVEVQRHDGGVIDDAVAAWSASELRLPIDHTTPAALLQHEAVRENMAITDETCRAARAIIQNFVLGYDVANTAAHAALVHLTVAVQSAQIERALLVDWLATLLQQHATMQTLLSESHSHAVIYFVEHIGARERLIPRETETLLAECLRGFGIDDLRDDLRLRQALLHCLQAIRNAPDAIGDFLLAMLNAFAPAGDGCTDALAQALVHWLQHPAVRAHAGLYRRWCDAVARMDGEVASAVNPLPIAPEYRAQYAQDISNPLAACDADTLQKMRSALAQWPDADDAFAEIHDAETRDYLVRAFPKARGGLLPVSPAAQHAGVQLLLVKNTAPSAKPRLVSVARVTTMAPTRSADGRLIALPLTERAMIENYRMLRVYRAHGLVTTPNHAIVILPEAVQLPWSAAGTGPGGEFSSDVVKRISRRIAGFARELDVAATEIILSLNQHPPRRAIEVWHVQGVGVVSRPPFPIAARTSEWDQMRVADARQRSLGKLLNADRAALLFDEGVYEELKFPDVDVDIGTSAHRHVGTEPVGLVVYRGKIAGSDALVYAGDFRHRGGALGEREGKKLAASVVLAYCLQIPLIGIHDGAGANIKGSVASLGWAGAYFGAIAATGGHATAADFNRWFAGHHEREYFEKVLAHFSATASPVAGRRSPVTATTSGFAAVTGDRRLATGDVVPLIHLHLHLGAAVGMLVYGPSISSCALMVDHPEVYRLLTGAATVARVTGEKGTNYDMGGAPVHGHQSGEVDLVLGDEAAVIAQTRTLLALLQQRNVHSVHTTIQRAHAHVTPALPISAGILIGREAIEANIDDGFFIETRHGLERAGGLLTGYAALAGRPVMLAAATTDYGLHTGRAFKKMQLAAAAAQDFGLPLILLVGANWDRLHPIVRTEALYQQQEMRRAIREAHVPKISIVLGPRSLERSVHDIMDLTCYVVRGSETAYELSRAAMLCSAVVDTLDAAFDWCAGVMKYVTASPVAGRRGPVTAVSDECAAVAVTGDRRPVPGDVVGVADILPQQLTQPYDMRRVLRVVLDENSFTEFFAGDQQPLIVGVARLAGRVVGIIADAPDVGGGAQTVFSISKFTRFHRFCVRFGLPIIEFNDSPAFLPGREQERSGIQGEGGKSIREEVLSTIPKLAVTLRQNYGGRYIHANLVTLGPTRRAIILEGARLGVMGAEGAVGVLQAKRLAAITDSAERDRVRAAAVAEYERTKLDPAQAMALGYANALVAPENLRAALIEQMEQLVVSS